MLKIIPGDQVKLLDSTHILKTGISSLELMERAALGFVSWWKTVGFDKTMPVSIFCGAGNNGGDGFAIARLLDKSGFQVSVFKCFEDHLKLSPDALYNFRLLSEEILLKSWEEFDVTVETLVIDAYLGVGLKGALRPEANDIIKKINSSSATVISIDIPSGLPSDDHLDGICVKADFTCTFAFPKLSLLFPEHGPFTGNLVLIDIGMADEESGSFESPFFYLQKKDILPLHRQFHRFSHKGDFGKVLLIAGSKGKMGAAILSSKAALRTGSGLVSALVPDSERQIFQISVAEAMCIFGLPGNLTDFDALGIGPGLGVEGNMNLLKSIFEHFKKPLVLDADAITILSENPELIPQIPKESILTPHLKEFDRLFGFSKNQKERLGTAKDFCLKWRLNLVIKGANSVICLSDGRQIFNSSGNQYMATAGSGDVLTGMITSFLGQGYRPENALICGVYHHGLAGEFASKSRRRSTIASDIIEAIPHTFVEMDIS